LIEERDSAMASFDAMEGESSPSRSSSSSGCQSGWTLYLEHSNGARCDPAAQQRWMVLQAEHADEEEDSMASDASSGPRPRPREPEADAARQDFELRHGFVVVDQRSYYHYPTTSCAGHRGSGSGSGRSLGSSTCSRSSQGGAKGGVARRAAAVVFQGGDATATRQYREVIVIDDDDDDELDDTASSSAVFSCPMAMVHAR
jgi:hypothetical protein